MSERGYASGPDPVVPPKPPTSAGPGAQAAPLAREAASYLHGIALAMRDESGVPKQFTVLRSAGPSMTILWADLLDVTESILGCKHAKASSPAGDDRA